MEHNLYITGLPYNMSQAEIEALLAKAGTVVSLVLSDINLAEPFAHRTAFARMNTRLEAVRAINMLDGLRSKGAILHLNEVVAPPVAAYYSGETTQWAA
jgi:RNA recognition motif-containing protein